MKTNKIEALAKHLKIDANEIEPCEWCPDTFEVDGAEYRVLTEDEAEGALREYIKENVWAFRPSFLEHFMPDGVTSEVLKMMQTKLCEDANEAFLGMIGKRFGELVVQAETHDGRGHFLAPYDSDELELEGFLAYRVN